MATPNKPRGIDRTAARERRAARQTQTQGKTNRAQLRAMEVRAAETRAGTAEVIRADATGAATLDAGPVAGVRRPAASSSRRPLSRPVVLTRDEEYRFIKSDLRRLLLTAGTLFVVMIVLLFVVD